MLAQDYYEVDMQAAGPVFVIILVATLAFTVFIIAAIWKVFTKAGEPGWASIIPIYNNYVHAQDRWTAVVVAAPLLHPDRRDRDRDHLHGRPGEELREGRGLRASA